ncbi:decapping and exoribonuclease protein-like [Mercenaria mercenaria]|uniref:decapping and exoribonuclease protein-like n=1 Tax=Mercenaria mercenaria TaxID=6596 RepID=UPI00234F42E9|nr:decapping and exoribonuclease protein-like [Mercenaria mercenaria]
MGKKFKTCTNYQSQQHLDEQSDQELNGVQMKLSKMKVSNEDGSETSVPCDITPDRKTRNLDTDFVCRRGLLAKIMRTPYEKKEDWLIAVTLYNGTYYMDDIETEQRKKDEAKWNGREMCCWGWKFEQYLTADSKDGVPDPDAQYNNCEAFYTVVEAQLNNHSLVFSGEVDALNVEEEKGSYYVEFKTNSEITRPRHENKFKRFKLMKWWAQSYIMGVQEIVCGFRGGNGIVHRLEFYNTQELPSLAAESLQNPWKPNVCFNFLDQLLSSIKSNIKTDDHKIVHILSWSPRQPVRCSQPLVDSEHNFFPDWYTEAVK